MNVYLATGSDLFETYREQKHFKFTVMYIIEHKNVQMFDKLLNLKCYK